MTRSHIVHRSHSQSLSKTHSMLQFISYCIPNKTVCGALAHSADVIPYRYIYINYNTDSMSFSLQPMTNYALGYMKESGMFSESKDIPFS